MRAIFYAGAFALTAVSFGSIVVPRDEEIKPDCAQYAYTLYHDAHCKKDTDYDGGTVEKLTSHCISLGSAKSISLDSDCTRVEFSFNAPEKCVHKNNNTFRVEKTVYPKKGYACLNLIDIPKQSRGAACTWCSSGAKNHNICEYPNAKCVSGIDECAEKARPPRCSTVTPPPPPTHTPPAPFGYYY